MARARYHSLYHVVLVSTSAVVGIVVDAYFGSMSPSVAKFASARVSDNCSVVRLSHS